MTSLHYPSLELCKKLTEAGFPRTEMYIGEYRHTQLNKEFEVTIRDSCYEWDYETFRNVWFCPSVMELLDEMPNWITIKYKDWDVWNYKLEIGRQWTSESIEAYYVHYVEWNWAYAFYLNTLPNALSEMWLWLKENNYLTK